METDYSRVDLCTGCDQPRVGAVRFLQPERLAARVHSPLDILSTVSARRLQSVHHRRTVSALVTVRQSLSDCKCVGYTVRRSSSGCMCAGYYSPSIIVGL